MARRRLARNTAEVLNAAVHLTGEVSHELGAVSAVSSAGRMRVGDGVAQGGNPVALQRHETPWGVNAVTLGIVSDDGLTDQTDAVLDALIALDGAPTPLRIPPGVRFDVKAVKDAAPNGAMMEWLDTVNGGQPPGYRNLHWTIWRKDLEADDWAKKISSGNHPAIFLDNDGTAGSDSGNRRLASILHSVGIDVFNDPILGIIDSWFYDPGPKQFVRSFRLQSRGAEAMSLTPWQAGANAALNSHIQAAATGRIYKVTTAGVLGVAAPGHNAGTEANGTAQLLYVREALNVDSTLMELRESGRLTVASPDTIARVEVSAAGRAGWIEVEAGADIVSFRDGIRGADIIRAAPNVGNQLMGFRSRDRQPVSGAVPVIGKSDIYLTQAGATNVTGFGGIAGLTSVLVDVFFGDGHSTLKHSANFRLKGDVDAAVPSGGRVLFERHGPHSGALFEIERNF